MDTVNQTDDAYLVSWYAGLRDALFGVGDLRGEAFQRAAAAEIRRSLDLLAASRPTAAPEALRQAWKIMLGVDWAEQKDSWRMAARLWRDTFVRPTVAPSEPDWRSVVGRAHSLATSAARLQSTTGDRHALLEIETLTWNALHGRGEFAVVPEQAEERCAAQIDGWPCYRPEGDRVHRDGRIQDHHEFVLRSHPEEPRVTLADVMSAIDRAVYWPDVASGSAVRDAIYGELKTAGLRP